MRGGNIIIDNPNITVNYAQGLHPSIALNQGTLNNGHVLYLDADYTGGNITGEWAYLRAGVDSDVMGALAGNSNAYFIKSEIALPSEIGEKLIINTDITSIVDPKDAVTLEKLEDYVANNLTGTTVNASNGLNVNTTTGDIELGGEFTGNMYIDNIGTGWFSIANFNADGDTLSSMFQNGPSIFFNAHDRNTTGLFATSTLSVTDLGGGIVYDNIDGANNSVKVDPSMVFMESAETGLTGTEKTRIELTPEKITIDGVMNLTPTTEPTTPTLGMLYWDITTGKLRFYSTGGVWNDLF